MASSLSAMPGPGAGGQAHRAAVRGADGRPDGRDLVLGLEGAHAEVLVRRQLVEDVAGGRDGVRAVEQVATGQLGRGHEAERGRLVAGDVAVRARRQVGRLHPVVLVVEDLGRLAEGVARLERPLVGLRRDRLGRELAVHPAEGRVHAPLVQPEHDAQGEEVLGQVLLLAGHVETLERALVEGADGDLEHVPGAQRSRRSAGPSA